ncbi:MAG: hypothetical protein H6658_13990 [Ardenticatenaceae bacterium]|nr:hypothetical protein [Ardenticatenaceae bacterium]
MRVEASPFLWLLIVGGLVILVACSSLISGEKMGNMTLVKEETALDALVDSERVLVFVAANASDEGIYWLDLDNHRLYLAARPQAEAQFTDAESYIWLPERDMVRWTGSELVYGHRLTGFWELATDGSQQQITEFGYVGQLAQNGEQVLRFRACGPDENGHSYLITPLDRFTGPPLLCLPRYVDAETPWYTVVPVWNPYLAEADFIVSERFGLTNGLRVVSNKLVAVADEGTLVDIVDLGTGFPILAANSLQVRPDGQAFYVYDGAAGVTRIVDRQGDDLVDFGAVDGAWAGWERNGRFSWSPDSQKAVLLFEDCANECEQVLVLAENEFANLTELATLPENDRFDYFIWSPDSTWLSLVTEIHQGADDPPRIYTINLRDQSVEQYVFPMRIILKSVQWVR